MGTGSPGDSQGYRDSGMATVGDHFRQRNVSAAQAERTGGPDRYREDREAQAEKNRARGAAKRGEG